MRRRPSASLPLATCLLALTLSVIGSAAGSGGGGWQCAIAQQSGGGSSSSSKKAVSLVITGDTVTVVRSLPCKILAPAGYDLYDWSLPESVTAEADGHVLTLTAAPKGQFKVRVRLTKIDFDKKKVERDSAEVEVNYGGGVVPPKPPGPTPDPPQPKPTEKLIAIDGFAVLIVYESGDESKLTREQAAILVSITVRAYLDSKCLKNDENKGGAYRIWDKDVDVSKTYKVWADAMRRERKGLPWIIISTPTKGGYEGPLPKDVAETMALLKKYGD